MAKIETEEVVVTKKQVYWVDANGNKVPVEALDEEVIAEDTLVSKLITKAHELQEHIKMVKAEMAVMINANLATKAGKIKKEWKGNAVLRDFSRDKAVFKKIGRFLTFDNNLQLAKQLIDDCIVAWGGDSNANLVAIVSKAFDVNQAGKVDAKEILGLRKLKIIGEKADVWKRAMDLIADAITVASTKDYFYFQEKDEKGVMRTIVLDFSSL
jgi:hypothetical protein